MAVVVLPTPPFWLATAITFPFSRLSGALAGEAGPNSGGCIILVNTRKHSALSRAAGKLPTKLIALSRRTQAQRAAEDAERCSALNITGRSDFFAGRGVLSAATRRVDR